MNAVENLSLEEVFQSLLEMGQGQRALPVLRHAARELASTPEPAASGLTLEGLLDQVRNGPEPEVADLTVAAIRRLQWQAGPPATPLTPNSTWRGPTEATGGVPLPATAQELFYAVAHAHEGSAEERRARYRSIAELIRPGERVVDIGCGDGTFLELVRERGALGVGIDVDPDKVAAARAKGLDARCGRAQEIDWDWGPVDFISMLHIVEHIPSEELLRILHHACQSRSDRGRLFILTPNIANPVVQVNFWLDITHVRPFPELILGTILQCLGFGFHQSGSMTNDLETWAYGFSRAEDAVS